MNIRFYNGKILMPDNTITTGEVWVQNSYITYVGNEKIPDIHFFREIDLKGNLLMPGFKNAHTHSPMTFLRSYADDMSLSDWLNKQVFPMEAKLTQNDVCIFTKIAVLEYLSSGITSAFDMYFYPESVKKACEEMGFRMVMCGAMNDFSQSVQEIEEYYNTLNSDLISYKIGFHAEYTTSIDKMKELSKLVQKYNAPFYVHSSETQLETNNCIKKYNKTPTQLFYELGLFNYGGGAFHSIYLTEQDMQIYKNNNISAITNPSSNLKLASGIAPICKMMECGINIAIGTDGPASNNALDMFREMYLVTALQKIQLMDASACDGEKVLNMAIMGGAKAMGLTDCDSIQQGKKADLIVIDLKRPNMQPINNILKNIVYSGSKDNVLLTMVNGKILYENRQFAADVEKIYSDANKRLKELIS